MTVKDIMSQPVVTVAEDALAPDIARVMQERDIGAVVVVDAAGALRGIVTESDFTGVGRCVPFSLALAPVVFGARAATMAEIEKDLCHGAEAHRPADHERGGADGARSRRRSAPSSTACSRRKLKHVPVVRDGKPVGMLRAARCPEAHGGAAPLRPAGARRVCRGEGPGRGS